MRTTYTIPVYSVDSKGESTFLDISVTRDDDEFELQVGKGTTVILDDEARANLIGVLS